MPEEVTQRTELTIALTFFVILTAFGVFLGGFAVQDFAHARASVDWPVVDGVVLSETSEVGPSPFRYAYVAGGRRYESRRVKFASANFLRWKFTAPPPGASISVRYDPKDASQSVILPGGSGGVFALLIGLSGVLVFVGLAGLIRTLMLSQDAERASITRDARRDAAA